MGKGSGTEIFLVVTTWLFFDALMNLLDAALLVSRLLLLLLQDDDVLKLLKFDPLPMVLLLFKVFVLATLL